MRRAAGRAGFEVELWAASLPRDRQPLPGFRVAPDLDRSVLDCGRFAVPRALPLVGDILGRLYQSSRADWFVFTNADIVLADDFYRVVTAQGAACLSVHRRTVRARGPVELD